MAVAASGVNGRTRFGLVPAALLLFGCASPPPAATPAFTPTPAPGPAQAPAPEGIAPDAAYDWHGLMMAPFGSVLKGIPVPLHEVLLFEEEAPSAAEGARKDCYALDATPPSFLGRTPDEYVLCFDHDRLTRIEASVRLPAETSAPEFARACAVWLKSSAATPGIGDSCEGRDGSIAFSARLGAASAEANAPGEANAPVEATAPVFLTLTDATLRDADR